ncbi:eukaryotic aspartyl protease [Xylariaceae sp. FL1272]|nr:eukaryotic aspartyl protease [Xylariaceae sp. FL1272]
MDALFAAHRKLKGEVGLTKVTAVHNQNYKRHGLKSYVNAMHKYGFEPTKDGPFVRVDEHDHNPLNVIKTALGVESRTPNRVLAKKNKEGDDAKPGEVSAHDKQNDTLYLCKCSIGTPPQNVMLDFDTGSADTWTFSTALNHKDIANHNVFNPKKSTTAKQLHGKKWEIAYGDGSTASGTCYSDVLELGGLKITGQTIETADNLSKTFISGTGDGLLGLAFSSINTVTEAGIADPQLTPVENMIKQDDIPNSSALFTSAFYSARDDHTEKSFYTFGWIDEDLVKESGEKIHWTEIDNSQGFWSVSSESSSVNGEAISQSNNTAIIDTGTTLAMMSDDVVEKLYAQIPGATYDWINQGYIIPVSITAEQLPEFTVSIGDKKFVIQKEDLLFAPTDDAKSWYGGVQSRGSLTFDILGDVFLKSVYCIWDIGNRRFGAVPKLEKRQNVTPPTAGDGDEGTARVTSIAMAGDISIDPMGVPLQTLEDRLFK